VSQVNLLPPEILEGQRWRRVTLFVAAGGLVVLGLVFLFYLLQVNTLSGVRSDVEAQRATNDRLRGEIAELQRFEDLQVRAQAQQELLASAYAGEVSFSGMLMDLSRVIPSDAALNSLGVTITPPATDAEGAATGAEGAATGFVGTMSTSGEAEGFDSLSTWLTRLEQVEGWVNPWMSTISRRDEGGSIWTFSSGVDLTGDVVTERGGRVVTVDAG
jgi:Tfp pilus assembly protein PilN